MGNCLDTDIDPKILITPFPPPPPKIFSLKGGVNRWQTKENFQIILHGGTGLAEIQTFSCSVLKARRYLSENKCDPVVFSKIVVGICNFFAVVIFVLNLTRLFWKI